MVCTYLIKIILKYLQLIPISVKMSYDEIMQWQGRAIEHMEGN